MTATPGQAAPVEITREPEIPVHLVQLWLCDSCLDGEGEECHTPGCSLWIHDVPKPAIRGSQGVTILGPALEPFMTREDFAARQPQAGQENAVFLAWYEAQSWADADHGWNDMACAFKAGMDARQPQPAPDLGAAYAGLESEIRDVLAETRKCRAEGEPCRVCERLVTRAMRAADAYARDVAGHGGHGGRGPGPENAL